MSDNSLEIGSDLGYNNVQVEKLLSREFLASLPKHALDFHGGAYPGVDILLDNVRIQVKTQIKRPPEKFRGGEWDYESSPTVKKAILEEQKCDILILVILYFKEDYSDIGKANIYVFNSKEFKYFNPRGCWSGNSKGDCTIRNVLYVNGTPPPKLKTVIDFYNTSEYHGLFSASKDAWQKLQMRIE